MQSHSIIKKHNVTDILVDLWDAVTPGHQDYGLGFGFGFGAPLPQLSCDFIFVQTIFLSKKVVPKYGSKKNLAQNNLDCSKKFWTKRCLVRETFCQKNLMSKTIFDPNQKMLDKKKVGSKQILDLERL